MNLQFDKQLKSRLLKAMHKRARQIKLSQCHYVFNTIKNADVPVPKDEINDKLRRASLRVREQSMIINKEFSDIEDDA